MPTEKKEKDVADVKDKRKKDQKEEMSKAKEKAEIKHEEKVDNGKKVEESEVTEEKEKIEATQKVEKKEEENIKEEFKEKEEQKKEIESEETAEQEESVSKEKPNLTDLNYYSPVRKDLPEIKPGDMIRVSYRVIEGGKQRIQVFEGTVIALKNSGISRTVTVRKTSFGIAVERIFPLNSKLLQKIEVKKHSKVRRAKLYYLRKLKGKAARLKELR